MIDEIVIDEIVIDEIVVDEIVVDEIVIGVNGVIKNRIMVVVDDDGVLRDCVANLNRAGFDCAVFVNSREATESLAIDSSYDLALLNLDLPNGTGFDLLTFMVMNRYDIPVICLTAQRDFSAEIRALSAGAEDCVTMPADFRRVFARVIKTLERRGKLNTVVRLGELVIDLANRSVWKNGREILLNPKEFNVLSLLVRHRNQTLSRQMILDVVWGTDYFGGTHTVDVKISGLRKKLGLFSVIRTVHKYGYRLEDASTNRLTGSAVDRSADKPTGADEQDESTDGMFDENVGG
ncbi:MAG: response regulator transcription factor [Peptococcaceae bacterium]|nr:response regulator transcription factor [Peptococcaceae bacterium]